ncbi:MAG: hypothetical protein D6719_11220 [Candidatus Dadabacteria bacterium]|nr:MAG: hypothetical protein D6719_11220 [Candidatus Dadabacteria bacterium]
MAESPGGNSAPESAEPANRGAEQSNVVQVDFSAAAAPKAVERPLVDSTDPEALTHIEAPGAPRFRAGRDGETRRIESFARGALEEGEQPVSNDGKILWRSLMSAYALSVYQRTLVEARKRGLFDDPNMLEHLTVTGIGIFKEVAAQRIAEHLAKNPELDALSEGRIGIIGPIDYDGLERRYERKAA